MFIVVHIVDYKECNEYSLSFIAMWNKIIHVLNKLGQK